MSTNQSKQVYYDVQFDDMGVKEIVDYIDLEIEERRKNSTAKEQAIKDLEALNSETALSMVISKFSLGLAENIRFWRFAESNIMIHRSHNIEFMLSIPRMAPIFIRGDYHGYKFEPGDPWPESENITEPPTIDKNAEPRFVLANQPFEVHRLDIAHDMDLGDPGQRYYVAFSGGWKYHSLLDALIMARDIETNYDYYSAEVDRKNAEELEVFERISETKPEPVEDGVDKFEPIPEPTAGEIIAAGILLLIEERLNHG